MNPVKKIFVSGYFNVLHPGHIRLLRFAKDLGGELVVGVYSDTYSSEAPLVKQSFRLEAIKANSWVSRAFIIEKSLISTLEEIKPDIIVKGREFEGLLNEEDEYISASGAKLIFSSGESFFSSFDLINNELSAELVKRRRILTPIEYIKRHNITKFEIISYINKFKDISVLVIGDLIVDEYISCEPLGMSQEDPTIVVKEVDRRKYIGGAGIVSAHAVGLGAEVYFATVIGSDQVGQTALSMLHEYGVKPIAVVDDSRPTTVKKRYRAKGKTLLRVSELNQADISLDIQDSLFQDILPLLGKVNLVVFSDFSYGVLPKFFLDRIIFECKKNKVMMIADSQSSSQNGDIYKFKNLSLLTPTEREARLGSKNFVDGLVVLAEKVQEETETDNIFLKLSEDGLLVCTRLRGNKVAWHTDKIEALNPYPLDTAGAGDSMLIAAGLSLCSGSTIWEAAYIGSIAAALQVGSVGNTPLNAESIIDQIRG